MRRSVVLTFLATAAIIATAVAFNAAVKFSVGIASFALIGFLVANYFKGEHRKLTIIVSSVAYAALFMGGVSLVNNGVPQFGADVTTFSISAGIGMIIGLLFGWPTV